MGLPKSKQNVGLGRTLINDRQKAAKTNREVARGGRTAQHTTEVHHEPNWVKLRSITQERALDEFLSTAELAGTEFTAESDLLQKQSLKKSALKVPRRPAWSVDTTPHQLELAEKDSFLDWRRGLAQLQESDDLLLTPFERNLEVWRQLWRVIERSDLVVQIVDGRNPLLFRTEDLERYVLEVDEEKRNLLLVNKADLMTTKQRTQWADWFEERRIRFAFYSARLAKEAQEKESRNEDDKEEVEENEQHEEDEETDEVTKEVEELSIDKNSSASHTKEPESHNNLPKSTDPISQDHPNSNTDSRIQILTVHELQSLFLREAPTPKGHDPLHPQKLVVGLVGYPNVGKSSTINSLLGEKRVSVSSTPGKTKHFQTIHLPPTDPANDPNAEGTGVILCDCPGLVFPNFASTKAELVCNGVLPIDQLREWTGPAELIARRVPKGVLEQMYSFKIFTKSEEEDHVTGEELLVSFALARGFTKAGHQGNPDDARAARILLKDFVNGKILYCHPPPDIDPKDFNEGHYTPGPIVHKELNPHAPTMPNEQMEIDQGFFRGDDPRARTRNGVFGGRNMQYDFQKRVGDDGRLLSGYERQVRQDISGKMGKKHFKGRGK